MQMSSFYFNFVKVIAGKVNADISVSDPGRIGNVQEEEPCTFPLILLSS